MSEESLHPVDMTGSMYIDIGADTKEGYDISSRSRGMARKVVGNNNPEDRIRQRCSIAVGDWAMADLLRFSHEPVKSGLDALASDSPIYTDIRMVLTGIQKKGHNSQITCVLDLEAGRKITERTRTSAGFASLGERLNNSIIVIGNAPSALLTICALIREQSIRPALIIGVPVGFVNAAESKDLLMTCEIPYISNIGTRGGTPVAVAAMNEIITMYVEKSERSG